MNKDKHAEAFCLMKYECEYCGDVELIWIELIWNSRDGVTPYIVRCPKCSKNKVNTSFRNDLRKPDHELKEGDRYFITPTVEQVKQQAKEVYQEHIETMEKSGTSEADWVNRSVKNHKSQPGSPMIKVYKGTDE